MFLFMLHTTIGINKELVVYIHTFHGYIITICFVFCYAFFADTITTKNYVFRIVVLI